jgi:RND family efflux transporter MFP subunit
MRSIYHYLLIGVIPFLYSCSNNTESVTETGKDQYIVINPIIKSTNRQNEYVAEINAVQNVEIRAKIKGFIDNVYVDEGRTVKKGQLLFSVSNSISQQELAKAQALVKMAEAELKAMRIELENARKLYEKDIISKAELDLAAAKVEAANAKVAETKSEEERAKLNLSFSQIKAPFDGIINRIPSKTGSLVEEGALLTTISNNQEVYTYFNVSEKDYLDLVTTKQDGVVRAVSLLLANGMEYSQKGYIETTESEFDKSTGNIAFRAKFSNPQRLLKHGGSGKIVIDRLLKDAIHIPQKSTFEVQDKLYVYILDSTNVLQQQSIEPILRIPHYYVVSEGIEPGDRILFEGVQNVKTGDKIAATLISREEAEKRINQ